MKAFSCQFYRWLVAFTGILVMGGVAHADITSIKAYDMPRTARNCPVQFNVRLIVDGKASPAGLPLMIYEHIGARSPSRPIGNGVTDGRGWVRFFYRVPSDPRMDDIHLSAKFQGQLGIGIPYSPSQSVRVRVPIGR